MRPSAQPFLWKWVLFAWEWKIISISKAEHLTSFWYRGPGELGNGLLYYNIIEAFNAAVNLKFYFYSARSRQYASMSTWHFFFTSQLQPPPQALRFSHSRGERETSDWWWTARDHGKGTDVRVRGSHSYVFVEGFPTKRRLRNERRNSILVTHHYPGLRPGTKGFTWRKWIIGYNFGIDDGAESKFGASKELMVLNISKYKYCVNKSRDKSRHHYAKNCELLTNWWPV